MSVETTIQPYLSIGRFAPSPTGPLHYGSLLAAVASYAASARWLVRIEDLDGPRTVAGAIGGILRTLERFGFEWDGEVVYQSRRTDLYREAFEQLRRDGLVYPCGCTRREIADSQPGAAPGSERPYPGTCRAGLGPGRSARAHRARVGGAVIEFTDLIQGPQHQDLESESGDFVLLRADGLWAYQLAVVVDDALQGVNTVVRGSDLLTSTPRQIWLQRRLALAEPVYAHVPVVAGADGLKLSKQTGARELDETNPARSIWLCLEQLRQNPPEGLTAPELLRWARLNWRHDAVPATLTLPIPPEITLPTP